MFQQIKEQNILNLQSDEIYFNYAQTIRIEIMPIRQQKCPTFEWSILASQFQSLFRCKVLSQSVIKFVRNLLIFNNHEGLADIAKSLRVIIQVLTGLSEATLVADRAM